MLLPTKHTTNTNVDTYVTSAGFEPAIPAIEWPQTYALGCTASEVDVGYINILKL